MDLAAAILNFLSTVVISQGSFIAFSFLVIITESLALWALWVSHMNKSIMNRRKELGMNEVDQAIQSVRKIMISHYLTLSKEKLGPDYFNRKETAIYRYLIVNALDELKPIYRIRIRRNHFNEKSPAEWTKYVHDAMEDDIKTVSNFLDLHYHPQARISRPEIFEHNKSIIEDIRSEIEDLFCQLLSIANQNKLWRFFGCVIEIGAESI